MIRSLVAKMEKKCSKYPLLFKIYSWPYKEILKNEISLAGVGPEDKVLNIGCGAMPFSAIYMARLTGAKVVAVDKDPEVIAKARRAVKDLKLENQIKVVRGDGSELEEIDFTVALVALQTEPKNGVLKNLLENSAKGSRLVFRSPRPFFNSQYDLLSDKFKEDGAVKQKMITFDRSLLFIS